MNENENKEELTLPVYNILTEKEISERAAEIDTTVASKEVLSWLVNNVQEYVDNKRKTYRIYITVADSTGMPNISELQTLYLGIESPEDIEDKEGLAREGRCLDLLDDITEKVHKIMTEDKDTLKALYSALIYYYEMIGFSSQSGPILQEFSGYVDMRLFLYEPVTVKVTVSETRHNPRLDINGDPIPEGGCSDDSKDIISEDMIPEGFGVEFVLKAWPKGEATMY